MRLLYKILFGYLLIVSVLGIFSTIILWFNVEKSSSNFDTYREREMTSFAKVIDAFIPNKEALKKTDELKYLFISTTLKLPHVKRLTLHAQDEKSLLYTHIVSSIPGIVGEPSHQEDIDAILTNTSTMLYEDSEDGDRYLDITYPILNTNLEPIAALGIAVSLKESDEILQKTIDNMKNDAMYSVLIAIAISMFIAFVIAFIISKKIVYPLEKLKRMLVSASANNLGEQIDITSNDEIGELAEEFNSMTLQLNTLYSSMESKVLAKTQELEKQFLTDILTGLENRFALFKYMKNLDNFHVAILDISAFKDINDVYGVELGNEVLKELSKKYAYYLNGYDLKLYRLSADEIALLNPNIMNKDEFSTMVEKIITNVEHETFYFLSDTIEINISIHAGISYEKDNAIEKANIALTKAKNSHTNYTIYNQTQYDEKKQLNNIETISKLKFALNNFGIIAHYQPIVDRSGNIIKYEALVRMKDAKEILSPHFFLDIAKRTKYYHEITKTMLFLSLEEFKNRDEDISINLCAEDIRNETTIEFIKEKLKNFIDPSRVIFELVESEDMHTIPELNSLITFIKSYGSKIAIDDFGTGYSNFAYLMDIEPDYIKIDGSLIKNIDNNKRSYNIVKTIVAFARELNIKVIAEFIHSKEVLEVCQKLNIDEYQGYYFSEPKELS